MISFWVVKNGLGLGEEGWYGLKVVIGGKVGLGVVPCG